MKRFVFGFISGAVFLGAIALTINLSATFKGPTPRYALVSTFTPQPAWTAQDAKTNINKFKSRLNEEKVKGLEIKYFLGAIERNEFGGFYQFQSKADVAAFLEKNRFPANRTVKIFEIWDTWKGN